MATLGTGTPNLLERATAASYRYRLLQIALVVIGALMLLLYPLSLVWPAGWAWHPGAPYESDYFTMIVGLYATLGAFLLNAARRPEANLALIWFTVCSSVVHGAIMTAQSFGSGHHMGHLLGDVPALFLENVADSRLLERIAAETGVRIGGKLYSDALSPPDGPAASYIAMMRSNARELTRVLTC